jgi:hypothetical protein
MSGKSKEYCSKEFLGTCEYVKELKMIADAAHKNAQFTMDANRRQVEHIKQLQDTLKKILVGLSEKMPIAKKIMQYDSIADESWIIEVPDQYEYSAFFDWVDENLASWKASVGGKT